MANTKYTPDRGNPIDIPSSPDWYWRRIAKEVADYIKIVWFPSWRIAVPEHFRFRMAIWGKFDASRGNCAMYLRNSNSSERTFLSVNGSG